MRTCSNQRLGVLLAGLGMVAGAAHAQLQVTPLTDPNLTPVDLAQALIDPGAGISIQNVVYNRGTGDSSPSAGIFSGGTGRVGFAQGILLSSGHAVDAIGPNSNPDTSQSLSLQGDADLQLLTPDPVTDVTILEFDFIPTGNQVFFQYVFSSEEYEEYVGTQFNDVFGFFINGENCAVVGPNQDPVTINTVNHLAGNNPGLYRSNTAGQIDIESDGLTVVLTCSATVNPGVINHMKIAIGDASDSAWDSWVFIEQGSITDVPPLVVEKSADEAESLPSAGNGYTITLNNPTSTAITVTSVEDLLPDGFSYAGPTTGFTTQNPSISPDGSRLVWSGNFVVPAMDSISISFPVTVSPDLGFYYNNATASSTHPVVPTGDTAPITVAECQKFIIPDVAYQDYASRQVSIDGDSSIISVISDEFPGLSNSGSARIITKTGGVWSQEALLVPAVRVNRDYFGSSVDITGDRAIVGARGDSSSRGAAYVFARSGGSWSELAKLVPSDGVSNDLFGDQVMIDGERAYVTAPYHDPQGKMSGGAVYVFRESSGVWVQEAKLVANDVKAGLYMGLAGSLDVDGERLVVGAPGENLHGVWTGACYIFKRTGTSWAQEAKLMAGDADGNDRFGWSVALEGDTLAVGAYSDEGVSSGPAPGSAYLFQFDGATWQETQKLLPADLDPSQSYGSFGVDLELDDGNLLVGSPKHDQAYLFSNPGGQQWKLSGIYIPHRQVQTSYKAFGNTVDIAGDHVMIGDEHDVDVVDFGGATYFCRFR